MSDLLLEFLTSIEALEARLLCWGYVDGGLSREEIIDRGDAWAIERDTTMTLTGTSMLEALERRGLILRVETGTSTVYRSRMAETVRLAARLRQMFGQHGRGENWLTAPTLVADFRFAIRPRTYPKRDVSVPQALAALREDGVAAARLAEAERLLTVD